MAPDRSRKLGRKSVLEKRVVELIRTNDIVLLSALQAELAVHGVEAVVLDTHTSIMEGSLGVLPRRLMVVDTDAFLARRIVAAFQEDHA